MKILSLKEADAKFHDAIEQLRSDRSFAGTDGLVDEHDVFVHVEDDLVFANKLDQLADIWDPVDGCWMEYYPADHGHPEFAGDSDEEIFDNFWKMLHRAR